MDPRVVSLFARHGDLLTRRQALAAGVTGEDIHRWVRAGQWVAVRRGVYALAEFWEGLDARYGRPLYLARAASLAMRMPHVMSHDSAALELKMAILLPDPYVVHVTRFGVLGGRTEHGVKHHKAPFTEDQIEFVEGRPVLDRARTAVDIAREHGLTHGVVAADSAMRAGVTRSKLEAAYASMRNWANVTTVRAAVDLADPGAENVAETLGRLLVTELGIGRPETQFGLRDGRREVWCDMRVGRHIFEFDGKVKYRGTQAGGVADRSPEEVLWAEKRRQDFICGFKLGMSRIVWDDLWGRRRELARTRLLREYLDTEARFGRSIADLAPYVIRGGRSRAA